MNLEKGFLQDLLAHPTDLARRLIFADWLEEQNDPRAELIRLLHTLTQQLDPPDRPRLEARLRDLLIRGVKPVGPFWTNSIGMEFACILPGTFRMGCPETEHGRHGIVHGCCHGETQHCVTLTKGFYLQTTLVTQEQWQAVMGGNPSGFRGDDNRPVENVSWLDVVNFCNKLSTMEGKKPRYRMGFGEGEVAILADGTGYRLPTEAEWEYTCRGGTTTPFWFGDTITTQQANLDGNYPYLDSDGMGEYRERTTLVKQFPANPWGLHDMHGNLSQWCEDRYDEDYPSKPDTQRVLRGSSWICHARNCRAAYRSGDYVWHRYKYIGFRLALCMD